MLVNRGRVERRLLHGLRESVVHQVFATAQGYGDAQRRLGVSREELAAMEAELGIRVRAYARPSRPYLWVATDEQVRAALLGPGTLQADGRAVGISGPALFKRARRIGLPTSRRGREALRQGLAA